ncbi:hypothetical protein K501DRAFT_288284 [Backusella circina FSU 941]|nr:hypothetical protein K501DRAFT_288284 [Backusella circina FSU 941]
MNELNITYPTQDNYLKSNNQNSTSYDLQDIIQQFQSHPELLKLILTSKVEEDKRKAEEAKLRTKELDVYLKNNQAPPSPEELPRKFSFADRYEDTELIPSTNNNKTSRKMSVISTNSSLSSYRMLPYPKTRDDMPTPQKHFSISSFSSEHSLDDSQQQRRHSAAAAMLAMGSGSPPAADIQNIKTDEFMSPERSNSIPYVLSSAYPSPVAEDHDEFKEKCELDSVQKPRRRREMQPITKIVETREYPYVDNYFWKNNGNTIQKKTGCKSVYYKCSNSNKGCSVNKTVTERPNGEYIIKYRGSHLSECGRVERIRDV